MAALIVLEPAEKQVYVPVERRPLVGDVHVEYPYTGEEECKLCGKTLSHYNPHIICYGCVERVRTEAWREMNPRMRDIIDVRRRKNRAFPNVKGINAALIGQAGTSTGRTSGHRPQSGHF